MLVPAMMKSSNAYQGLLTESREPGPLNLLLALLNMETGGLLKFSSLVGRCREMSPASEPELDLLGTSGAAIVASMIL